MMIGVGCQYYRKFYWKKKVGKKLTLTSFKKKFEIIREQRSVVLLVNTIINFLGGKAL